MSSALRASISRGIEGADIYLCIQNDKLFAKHEQKGLVLLTLLVVVRSNLSQVTEVVSLHLQVEYFAVSRLSFGD